MLPNAHAGSSQDLHHHRFLQTARPTKHLSTQGKSEERLNTVQTNHTKYKLTTGGAAGGGLEAACAFLEAGAAFDWPEGFAAQHN